jgi:salicylate hydroxylase
VKELEQAFSAFDQSRRERTQKNVTTSYEAGKMYDFELFGDDLDKIEESYKTRMGWIWNVNLEEQLAQAQKVMKQ